MSKLRAERGSLCFGVKHEYEINKLLKVGCVFFECTTICAFPTTANVKPLQWSCKE